MASQDKVSEKVQAAIFAQLLNTPANDECADCGNRSPTWVSLDFGVFVCMRCSGVHRQLGPHISRVRSVKLDGWTKDNIEIMAKVGNKVANDYYEHKMPTGYRKPGTNSSPEECRRFVDEKYIKKAFVPAGYQEPVKELLASRKSGTEPDFSYSKQKQNKQPEPVQPVVEAEPKSQSQSAFKFIRKKSMSLDRANEALQDKKPAQHNQHNHHHQDLLSPDVDLLGSDPVATDKLETHSASPVKKINFANFKKAQGQPGMHHSNSQPDHLNAAWGLEEVQAPSDNSLTSQAQPQENKVDVMKLYSQPQGHQNHFMSGMQQNWQYSNGWNNNFHGGYQGGFPPNYGQGFQGHSNMGYNPYMNQGHMGVGGNFGQGGMQNQFNNNGFVQAPGPNKHF